MVQMASLEPETIFHLKLYRREGLSFEVSKKSSVGFTLIEILVVLAIIGIVLSLGMPAIETITVQKVNSTTRKFMGLIKSVRNDAILLNLIHRLAINLDDQTWWVESQKNLSTLSKNDDDASFYYADKYSKSPQKMPSGVVFSKILKQQDGLHDSGTIYIHFFPNGFIERAILYIKKENAESAFYSLIINHSTGKVNPIPGEVKEL